MPWSTEFDDPIELPDGQKLVSLEDAGEYILALPRAEKLEPKWQCVMEALKLIAESGGPTMLARIGVTSALNRHVEPVYDPDLKMPHWSKRKLKRNE